MANMSLGSLTFVSNPSAATLIRPDKSAAKVPTYSSVAYFSWGTSIAGREILLEWDSMPSDMFDDLDDLFKADASLVFNPQDGSAKTYNAEIMSLDGKYFIDLGIGANIERRDVKMTLVILSQI